MKPKRRDKFYVISICLLAAGFAFIHVHHVSTLFENDRHFSHLSNLEREMTFRTEMGFYYHFYKEIVNAPSFDQGLNELMSDNRTEYPDIINALERFNLYPEIIIGGLYRIFDAVTKYLDIPTKQCWEVSRGPSISPVNSCEGLGDPMYFYLEFVWYSAGLSKAALFVYAVVLSWKGYHTNGIEIDGFLHAKVNHTYHFIDADTEVDTQTGERMWGSVKWRTRGTGGQEDIWNWNLLYQSSYGDRISDSCSGGLLAVLSFLYNHRHCTRVQWSPPLRESFGYPFCLLQMLAVTSCLKSSHDETTSKRKIFLQVWSITTLTAFSLVLWQFSQFVVATQSISVLIIFCLGIITKKTLLIIIISQMVGLLQAAIMLFGNVFLFQSILFSLLLAIVVVVLGFDDRIQNPIFNAIFIGTAVTGITISLKLKISQFFGAHDSHVLHLLASKVTNFKNFHTMLYTCSAEFDFLPISTIRELTVTGLIPTVLFVICLLLYRWRKNLMNLLSKQKTTELQKPVDPEVAYNILQLGAFTVMAAFIMRLKLFWSPHLCLIASLIMAPKYMPVKNNVRYSLLMAIIAVMSYHGISNVIKQRNIMGEYVNIPFEEVLTWINSETLQTDVFAGPMSIMANVLLSTGRRIVNHPHYEHQKMRDRTMKVYSVFSRRNPKQVYSTLAEMGVDYVILDEAWCFPRNKENCSMVELWDLVDSDNRNNEPLCPRLFEDDPTPFIRAFTNEVFVILSLKARQSIEISPLQQYQI